MGLNLILDKSAFQSLNYSELVRLNIYYKHNVAPVLVMEILGDLKKESVEGKKPSDERVRDFANKLFPSKSVVNSYYRNLWKNEFEGNPYDLDGRPILEIEKVVQTDDGRKGFVVQETVEEKSIYKWKEGNFTAADHELSELWRSLTTKEDLLKNLQKSLQSVSKEKIKSFDDLNKTVNSIIKDPANAERLLVIAIENYGEGEVDGVKVFKIWFEKDRPPLSSFIPYVIHCLKVDLLFHFGLQSELVGTRPTNKVDLEYLYYLPFCNIFSSNDKIHKQLAPLLLRDNQKFIVGEELKADLKNIVDYLHGKDDATLKQFSSYPPILEESLTYNLWKEYFNYPDAMNFKRKITEKELENAKEQMKKFEKAMNGEQVEFGEGDAEEFIVKQSTIGPNDPCLCGSGKKVIECCIPKDEFIKISKDQSEKKKRND